MASMLSRQETRKDTVQVAVETAFEHVGQIVSIITRAGRDITRELGEWASELFEMRDAARRAQVDATETERSLADQQAIWAEHRAD